MPFIYSEKDILETFSNLRKQLKEINLKTSEFIPAFKSKKHKYRIQKIRTKIDQIITIYKRLEQIITIEPNVINYLLQDEEI